MSVPPTPTLVRWLCACVRVFLCVGRGERSQVVGGLILCPGWLLALRSTSTSPKTSPESTPSCKAGESARRQAGPLALAVLSPSLTAALALSVAGPSS
eukprot:3268335-Rhodomonas_salina.1